MECQRYRIVERHRLIITNTLNEFEHLADFAFRIERFLAYSPRFVINFFHRVIQCHAYDSLCRFCHEYGTPKSVPIELWQAPHMIGVTVRHDSVINF